jgi:hypothetical protein
MEKGGGGRGGIQTREAGNTVCIKFIKWKRGQYF